MPSPSPRAWSGIDVEVAYVFLERPQDPVLSLLDRDAMEAGRARIATEAERIGAGEFAPAPARPVAGTCAGAAPPWVGSAPARAQRRPSEPARLPILQRSRGMTPSLFEWAGGAEAFERMIGAFYDRVEEDDLFLSVLFPGGVSEEHRDRVGPGGSRCSAARLATARSSAATSRCWPSTAGSRISAEQRFRFASLMSLAADDAGMRRPRVPLGAGRLPRVGNSACAAQLQPGAEVVEHAPVPRWGWGEAPPYEPSGS